MTCALLKIANRKKMEREVSPIDRDLEAFESGVKSGSAPANDHSWAAPRANYLPTLLSGHTELCKLLNLERETRLELATPTLARSGAVANNLLITMTFELKRRVPISSGSSGLHRFAHLQMPYVFPGGRPDET